MRCMIFTASQAGAGGIKALHDDLGALEATLFVDLLF